MKKFLTLLAASLIVGCSTTQTREQMVYSPVESEDFGVYVRLFQKEAETRNLDLHIATLDRSLRIYKVDKFEQDFEDAGVIGLCVKTAGQLSIYVSRRHWNSYDSQQREMLIFHELGHCALNLEHDQSLDSEGVPNDLMYPVNFDSLYYYKYRKFYLDHMFSKITKRDEEGGAEQEDRISTCKWGLIYSDGKVKRDTLRKNQRHTPAFKTRKFQERSKT